MVKVCYLCGRKRKKDGNVSFYMFPKNVDIRKKWMKACGLNELDDPSHLVICSQHFSDADIAPVNINARINSGLVPSTNMRNVRPSIIPNVEPSFVDSHIVFESNKLPKTHEVNILPPTSQKVINDCMGDGSIENINLNNQPRIIEINTLALPTENTVINNDPFMEMQLTSENVNTDVNTLAVPTENTVINNDPFMEVQSTSENVNTDINTLAVPIENTVINNDPFMEMQSTSENVNTNYSYTDQQFSGLESYPLQLPFFSNELVTPLPVQLPFFSNELITPLPLQLPYFSNELVTPLPLQLPYFSNQLETPLYFFPLY